MASFTSLPSSYTDGDTIAWAETLTAYPVLTSSVVYRFAGPEQFTVTGAESGAGTYTFTLPGGKLPGRYAWQQVATISGVVETLARGFVDVLPNLATVAAVSTAQAILTLIEAAIATLSSGTNQSASVNGESYTRKDLGQLREERTHWKAEVIREQNALRRKQGLPLGNITRIRYVG